MGHPDALNGRDKQRMVVTTNRVSHNAGSGYGTNNSQCTVAQYMAAGSQQPTTAIPPAVLKHLKARPFFNGSTDMENSGQGPSAWKSTSSSAYENPEAKREGASPSATVLFSPPETSRFRGCRTIAPAVAKGRPSSGRMRAADPVLAEDDGKGPKVWSTTAATAYIRPQTAGAKRSYYGRSSYQNGVRQSWRPDQSEDKSARQENLTDANRSSNWTTTNSDFDNRLHQSLKATTRGAKATVIYDHVNGVPNYRLDTASNFRSPDCDRRSW